MIPLQLPAFEPLAPISKENTKSIKAIFRRLPKSTEKKNPGNKSFMSTILIRFDNGVVVAAAAAAASADLVASCRSQLAVLFKQKKRLFSTKLSNAAMIAHCATANTSTISSSSDQKRREERKKNSYHFFPLLS